MIPEQSGKAGPAESMGIAFLGCVSLAIYLLGNATFHHEVGLILANIAKAAERLGW